MEGAVGDRGHRKQASEGNKQAVHEMEDEELAVLRRAGIGPGRVGPDERAGVEDGRVWAMERGMESRVDDEGEGEWQEEENGES